MSTSPTTAIITSWARRLRATRLGTLWLRDTTRCERLLPNAITFRQTPSSTVTRSWEARATGPHFAENIEKQWASTWQLFARLEIGGVRYLFRGLDISRLHARYAYPHQPHDIVFSHLLERIDEYTAKTHQTEQTIVVADQIATQEDHKAQFIGYQQDGTAGYRPSRLERISAPINFADSRRTPGLQAADLAVYIHRRRSTMREKHPQARRSMARIINLIDPTTEHSWTWKP